MLQHQPENVLIVKGGQPLHGRAQVAGFKHVLVLALSYLVGSGRGGVITNVPDILETRTYLELLPSIGVDATMQGQRLEVRQGQPGSVELPDVAAEIHGSLYLLPALLARHGKVAFASFGGCPIGGEPRGGRPWRHAVRVLERFGAHSHGDVDSHQLTTDGLRGADIDLREFAVDRELLSGAEYSGATKTALLAAAFADGVSVLRHPYRKYEVLSLLDMLTTLGVDVVRHSDRWEIRGGTTYREPVRLDLPPDLMEVVTWVTMSTLTGGQVEINGVSPDHITAGLAAESELWRQAGISLVQTEDDCLSVSCEPSLRPLDQITVTPGTIYSDSQPLFAALATRCPGRTTLVDKVWGKRFGYLDGFRTLGVDAAVNGDQMVVNRSSLVAPDGGALVHASDLRTAAALLSIAVATSGGPVVLHGPHHLDRGYDGLVDKLRKCDADLMTRPRIEV